MCKLLFYNFYITGVYDPLYSAVHPMKYLESDVIHVHSIGRGMHACIVDPCIEHFSDSIPIYLYLPLLFITQADLMIAKHLVSISVLLGLPW